MKAFPAGNATPMPFQIGQEVEIVGPDIDGFVCAPKKSTVEMISTVDNRYYVYCAWYPASSLRLVPKLKIGDRVRVIGKSVAGYDDIGKVGKIDGCNAVFSEYQVGVGIYPASSLALVEKVPEEELKVGDYVEAIGPSCLNHVYKEDSKIFQIERVNSDTGCVSHKNMGIYYPNSLRKLSPAEVQAHLPHVQVTASIDCSGFLEKLEKTKNNLWKFSIEQRLAAIEKRQDKLDSWITRFAKVGARLEEERADLEEAIGKQQKRMDFVEAIQKGDGLTDIGSIAAIASFGPIPACIAEFQKREAEEAEMRKKGDCRPTGEPILVRIHRGDDHFSRELTCPGELITWCTEILDNMKSKEPGA